MRKFIPILLILALVGGGAYYWFMLRPPAKDGELKLFGNVEIREAEASFRQGGRINDILVDEGDKVIKGQEIATLDTDTFEEAIASSDAEIAVAGAEFSKLNNGTRSEEIALADANVRQTEAILKNAEEDYNRQASLVPSGAVADKVLDAARTSRDVAKANYDAARNTLALRRAGFRKEDIASGQGRLQAAKAGRARLQTALRDTSLTAPVDGIIISRTKEVGALVAPGQPIVTIALSSPVYVRAYAPETALARLAPGTLVNITNDSSDKIYHGRVGFVSPKAEFTPKTVETEDLRSDLVYRLRIVVDDNDGKLLQGMPITIILPTPARENGAAAKK